MSARGTDTGRPQAHESLPAQRLVVAIDGPSGAGKSTIARRVATALGLRYLDTGAMYRAATWQVLDRGIDPADPSSDGDVVAAVRGLVLVSGTDPQSPSIVLNAAGSDPIDLTEAVRSAPVTAAVSAVSAIPAVREFLVAAQRIVIGTGGIVVEGRDIGTTVWPAAAVKVYLTASEDARATRRSAEEQTGATAGGDVQRVRADLARRDRIDSGRAVSPLVKAADAVVVDSTALGIGSVVEQVLELVRTRTGIGSGDDLAPRSDAEPFQRTVILGDDAPDHHLVLADDGSHDRVTDLSDLTYLDDRVAP
jgi:cytidylate kinase